METVKPSSGWFEAVIKASPNPAGGLVEAILRGVQKNGIPFGVAFFGDCHQGAWVLVHISTGQIAPATFSNQNDAILAAERLATIGDWESALQDWNSGDGIPGTPYLINSRRHLLQGAVDRKAG